MSKRRPSTVFTLQSNASIGSLSHRRASEDMEYAIAAQPSDVRMSHTHRVGSVIPQKRLVWAISILLSIFVLFLGRAMYLQMLQGEHYLALAESNRYRVSRVLPKRGMIYDRAGIVLGKNIPSFMLVMVIADLPKDEQERHALFEHVSLIAGLQLTDLDLLLTEFASTPTEPIPVVSHLPYDRAIHLAIETKTMPGFFLQTSSLRQYPVPTLSLSHVLGYVGKLSVDELDQLAEQNYRPIDSIGKNGIEKSAERQLRGTAGERIIEVDARGRELSVVSKTDPIPGQDVHLTIDAGFQSFIETRTEELFFKTHTSRASIVALNPKTGEIYALVSLPAYDNNDFAKGIDAETFQQLLSDKDKPLFPRAVAGEFPSGSTLKPFIAYAALAERLITEHTSFISTGGLRIGDWFFPDWKAGGHGVTDVTKAIAESVNTFFYIIGGGYESFTGLGVEKLSMYAKKFGFGSTTGIDIAGEADGFLPTKAWKEETKNERWYVGDTYHLAIGQGDFLTTPLQMASATGIIANNGIRNQPHLIQSDTILPGESIEGLDVTALNIVQNGMRQTVLSGSARSLQVLPFATAAKTGTAQSPGSERYLSWFTGFAPFDDPEIALAIIVEEGGESTEAAVPLARDILSWWFVSRPTE